MVVLAIEYTNRSTERESTFPQSGKPSLWWRAVKISLLREADLSGLETAFITAYRLIRKNRRGIGENDDGRVSLLGLRLPVQDDRDVRGRAFVCGEIDQEPLAIGGRGIILLVESQR